MAYQMTFKRYELKYLLNRQEKEQILLAMKPYMKLDDYGKTVIRNIYFDTDTFRLIRRSLEKPVYKEKLRIRSYKPVEKSDPVFVEIKKKYKSVVYKRRLQLPEEKVMDSFQTGEPLPVHSQIGNEIQYFRDYYENLHPSVFLSYEREAYYSLDGSGLCSDNDGQWKCRNRCGCCRSIQSCPFPFSSWVCERNRSDFSCHVFRFSGWNGISCVCFAICCNSWKYHASV